MFLLMLPSLSAVSSDLHRRHAQVIRKALQHSYASISAACIDMEVSLPNFSNELAGERPLRFAPLMKLNDEFWRWYPVCLTDEFGLPSQTRTAMRLALAAFGTKRMARMGKRVMDRRSA